VTAIRAFARNAASLTLLRLLTIPLRLFYVVLVARALGAEQYGDLVYSLNFSLVLLGVALLGTDVVVARDLAGRVSRAPFIVGKAVSIRLASAAAAALICVAWAMLIDEPGHTLQLIVWFALGLVFRAVARLGEAALVGLERGSIALWAGLAGRALELALITLLFFFDAPVWLYAAAYAGSWLVQAVLSLGLLPRIRISLRLLRLDKVWRLVCHGVPLGLIVAAQQWLIQSPVLLSRDILVDKSAFGQLALAIQMVAVLVSVPRAVSMAALPLLSRGAARGDRSDASLFAWSLQLTWLLGGAAILVTPLLSDPLLGLVFGPAYAGSAPYLNFAMWLFLAAALLSPFTSHSAVHGDRWLQVVGLGAAAIVALVLIEFAGPHMAGPDIVLLPTYCIAAALLLFYVVELLRQRLAPARLYPQLLALALLLLFASTGEPVSLWLGIMQLLTYLGLVSWMVRWSLRRRA
jgi:O-antigen/teichoic acid export membrane protein